MMKVRVMTAAAMNMAVSPSRRRHEKIVTY
jgi:hypothetical protein